MFVDRHPIGEDSAALLMYWVVRGLYGEARRSLEPALAIDKSADDTRRRLLSALATVAYAQGDHSKATEAADEAASLATELGGATERIALLREHATAARLKGDYELAERLLRERLDLVIAVGNGVGASASRLGLAYIANKTRRHEMAEVLLAENLPFVRSKGQTRCEASTLASLAETGLYLAEERGEDALRAAGLAHEIGDNPLTISSVELVAAAAATRGDGRLAALLLSATEAIRESLDLPADEDVAAIRKIALDSLGQDRAAVADAWDLGRRLTIGQALEVARQQAEHSSPTEMKYEMSRG